MTMSGDDIVEAFLLKLRGEEHRTLPTLEEEATLLGKEIKLPQVPRSPEWPEIPRFVEPAKQTTTSSDSSSSPTAKPSHLPSGKSKKSQQGMKANLNSPGRWVRLYLHKHDSARMVEKIYISPLFPGWMHEQHPGPRVGPPASHCLQAASHTNQERQVMDCPPIWGCWDAGITFPQRISRELMFIKWCGMKKWWHWPWSSRLCAVHSGMPLGMFCRVVQELHRCLTSMIESSDPVDLKMLDVAKRDPRALPLKGEHHHQCPGWNLWLV